MINFRANTAIIYNVGLHFIARSSPDNATVVVFSKLGRNHSESFASYCTSLFLVLERDTEGTNVSNF